MNYWDWDVKDTLGGGRTMADTIGTRSINLMAYLLHNIPYLTLYDDHIENVVDRLLINLDRFPSSLLIAADGSTDNDLGADLAIELQKISDLIEPEYRPSGLRLRHYFEHQGAPDSTGLYFDIAEILRNLPRKLDHFCMPFLPIYDDPNRHIPITRMNTYLKNLGAFTLFDIYTLSNATGKYQSQIDEVDSAKAIGILTFTDRTAPELVIKTKDPKNGYVCNSGTACDPGDPNDWCNLDENGNCTIAS